MGKPGSSLAATLSNVGFSSAVKDFVRYFPRGVGNERITTPDGVHLELHDMSAVTIGRFQVGDAERPERQVLSEIPTTVDIIELGAGTGYLTTLVNRRTDHTHLAVEPNPIVFPILERTRELNDATFQPVHKAYHPDSETVSFPKTKYFKTKTMSGNGGTGVVVDAISLTGLIGTYDLDRPFLHVDIEGSEELLFEHELDTLVKKCCGVLIEFHPDQLSRDVPHYVDQLQETFRLESECGNVMVFRRG